MLVGLLQEARRRRPHVRRSWTPSTATRTRSAPGTSLLATYFFAFQIYCDFSGYSDIALRRGAGPGLSADEELRPALRRATSIGEFWRRWHISLSTWFRDYLYIPLGGNRAGALPPRAST